MEDSDDELSNRWSGGTGRAGGTPTCVHSRCAFMDFLKIPCQENILFLQISHLESVLTRKFYFESENEKHTTVWKELEEQAVLVGSPPKLKFVF